MLVTEGRRNSVGVMSINHGKRAPKFIKQIWSM